MIRKINEIFKVLIHIGLSWAILLGFMFIAGLEGSGSHTSPRTSNNSGAPNQIFTGGKKMSAHDFLDDLPIRPVAAGSPLKVSNSYFEVSLSSDKYIYFSDFQILFMWATVKNLGSSEDKFSFELISKVPAVWSSVNESGGSIWLKPGKEDDIKFMCTPVYISSKKKKSTFKYRVTSSNHKESLTFSFTVVGYPQISSKLSAERSTSVGGTVTDAVTGNPISGAEVTLWLGPTIRIMPHDMMDETGSMGTFNISCWDIDAFNNYYDPYLSVSGYRLVVQKEGYKTYVHDQHVKPLSSNPISSNPITQNISLTPLDKQVNYELKWETALSSPGAWWIKVTDAWDHFAVALGKHPDAEDPAKLPTKIPFIDNKGNILWEKELPDQSWAIDVTNDGSYVACATNSLSGENYCYLWDAAGNQIWKKSISGESYDVKFSHDNQRLATGPHEDGASLVLYDTLTGVKMWDHNLGGIRCVRQTAFTKDGKYILAGQTLHLFKANGNLVWRRYHSYVPYAIWPSSNGKRIMVPDKGDCLSMFNIKGKLLWRREQRVITYGVMSANASVVVITTTHGYVFCYNKNGKIKWYHYLPGSKGCGGHNAADITPDGKYIVVGGGGYSTVLYDSNGNLLWRHTGSTPYDSGERGLKQSVMAVRISEDGKKIASGYGTSDPKLCYFEKSEASLEFIARGTSQIPDKGQVIIRKVYEVDPLLCPHCGGQMSIIAFIEEHKVTDKIIAHLKLTFHAQRPPPSRLLQQELLMAAEEKGDYF